MQYIDFCVEYNPTTDTQRDILKRILYTLYIKRMKHNKPVVTFIQGDSGEGKSWAYLGILELLSEIQGIDAIKYLDAMNVYVPIEYPNKLENILFNKMLKNVNMIGVHEARVLVNAKDWHNFVPQAISTVNALSRGVKRIAFFIISQFIRDITADVRYTITYYLKVYRPIGHNAQVSFYVLWKDDSDLDKPKLRYRRLRGHLRYPDGSLRDYIPRHIEFGKPSKVLRDAFNKSDKAAKTEILKQKLDDMMKKMRENMGIETLKLNKMVDFWTSSADKLQTVGKWKKDKFIVNKDFGEVYQLTAKEVKDFESRLSDKLRTLRLPE